MLNQCHTIFNTESRLVKYKVLFKYTHMCDKHKMQMGWVCNQNLYMYVNDAISQWSILGLVQYLISASFVHEYTLVKPYSSTHPWLRWLLHVYISPLTKLQFNGQHLPFLQCSVIYNYYSPRASSRSVKLWWWRITISNSHWRILKPKSLLTLPTVSKSTEK